MSSHESNQPPNVPEPSTGVRSTVPDSSASANSPAHVQMSATTLHHHFRQLAAMKPVAVRKWMLVKRKRAHDAERDLDAASAALQVGYEVPPSSAASYSRLSRRVS